jgi:hypothetical protein
LANGIRSDAVIPVALVTGVVVLIKEVFNVITSNGDDFVLLAGGGVCESERGFEV